MALYVDRGLGMEGEHVCAGVGKLGKIPLRPLHHQMHVERPVGQLPERTDERRSKRQVGDEVAVHHIYVDPLGSAGHRALDLFLEPAEIGTQHTGRNPHGHGASSRARVTTNATAAPLGLPTPAEGRVASTTPAS
jgi:hypothetical protein